jgi:hypothetical protein
MNRYFKTFLVQVRAIPAQGIPIPMQESPKPAQDFQPPASI